MRQTKKLKLYPLNKGLDLSSIPGGQDPRSLTKAINIVIRNRGSLRKAPGIRGLGYSGDKSGIQAATQFFGTVGGSQVAEIIQVRKGRVEVIRNNQTVDLGVEVSPSDAVVFEKFGNKLIIHFENTAPKTFTAGATELEELGILDDHKNIPPTFSVKHDASLWYGGRGNFPDRVTKSAINDIANYSLNAGGNQFRIAEGDGDPLGVTGLSKTFRGSLFAFKFNSIHRIARTDFGYGIEEFAQNVGCVHHNTIVTLRNEVFFTSSVGIHSLSATDQFGDLQEAILSFPIFEWFQENVNWAASKYMKAAYDSQSNSYILCYPSYGRSVPNRILGFNILTKEFWEWWDEEYPVVTEYFDVGRRTVMVGSNGKGLGVLDDQEQTRFGAPFTPRFKTGIIFPLDEKQSEINFTKAWLFVKPLKNSFDLVVKWYVDDEFAGTTTLDPVGGGTGSQIGVDTIGGTETIQGNKERFLSIPFELNAEGSCIEFEIIATPNGENDTKIEVYGLELEFEYSEDSDTPKAA